ncbi:MAG: FAD/NAD(P)-binding oxidoreductase [Acetobacter papayae]
MTTADVIIIGGGPSGVAAGLALRKQAVPRVVLLEREAYLGGATRHCAHSPFGMREFGRVYFGAAYGRRLERAAHKAGLDIRTGHAVTAIQPHGVVQVVSAHGTQTLHARRVLVMTGARERSRAARLLPGDRPQGVITTGTLQAGLAFHHLKPFRRPVILGTELVSLSALLTCLTHGIRPVAMIETAPAPLARWPLRLFPRLMGVPLLCGVEVSDIQGAPGVESVTISKNGTQRTLPCDGLLLTGRFTPESALCLQSDLGVDPATSGPAIDQYGRTHDPLVFAGGNILRAIETGGWAFREGRAIGAAVADDLRHSPETAPPVPVTFDAPLRLVVPSMLRDSTRQQRAFSSFQLRFDRAARGVLRLMLDGEEVWRKHGTWLPERRVLVPLPVRAAQAARVHFHFEEQN